MNDPTLVMLAESQCVVSRLRASAAEMWQSNKRARRDLERMRNDLKMNVAETLRLLLGEAKRLRRIFAGEPHAMEADLRTVSEMSVAYGNGLSVDLAIAEACLVRMRAA